MRGPVEVTPTEAAIIECMRHETVHIDSIITRSGLAPATVLQTLLDLELKGVVQQLPGKHFVAALVDVRLRSGAGIDLWRRIWSSSNRPRRLAPWKSIWEEISR